jgi:hypothetical protein
LAEDSRLYQLQECCALHRRQGAEVFSQDLQRLLERVREPCELVTRASCRGGSLCICEVASAPLGDVGGVLPRIDDPGCQLTGVVDLRGMTLGLAYLEHGADGGARLEWM